MTPERCFEVKTNRINFKLTHTYTTHTQTVKLPWFPSVPQYRARPSPPYVPAAHLSLVNPERKNRNHLFFAKKTENNTQKKICIWLGEKSADRFTRYSRLAGFSLQSGERITVIRAVKLPYYLYGALTGFAINHDIDLITMISHAECHLPSVHRGHGRLGIQWILFLPPHPSDPVFTQAQIYRPIVCNINTEKSI